MLEPLSADHAAQTFRVELFQQEGIGLWNSSWFGGHHLPGYSVLSPAIASAIGFRTMAVLSVLGTVFLFALIVDREWGVPARAGALWFGVAACVSLYSGRSTFALGVFVAALAIFLAQRGYFRVSLLTSALVALASPVAALFLACLGLSHWIARGRDGDRRGLWVSVVAFGSALVIAILFPSTGDEPYVLSSFLPAIAITLAAAALLPSDQRLVRTGLLVYAAALVAAFLFDTPMGGNANRLGVLLVGPLFACAAWSGRRSAVLVLLPIVLAWQVVPVVRDLVLVEGQPATRADYYLPIVERVESDLLADPGRIEVLPVASHWESARIAPVLPLARGWERQTDRGLNRLFYEGSLDPASYRRWLDSLAVRWVAVPRTDLDYSARGEADLIGGGLDYLEPVPAGPDWSLYRVVEPQPMARPPAELTQLGPESFEVSSPVAGSFRVAVRWSPWWQVVAGRGCVAEGSDGMTSVTFPRPGRLEFAIRFDPASRFSGGERCR